MSEDTSRDEVGVDTSRDKVRVAIAAMSAEGMHYCAHVTEALLAERDALRAELESVKVNAAELQELFQQRWRADMRATKQWQAAHEGKELTWPNHVDLVLWLSEQVSTARREAAAAMREAAAHAAYQAASTSEAGFIAVDVIRNLPLPGDDAWTTAQREVAEAMREKAALEAERDITTDPDEAGRSYVVRAGNAEIAAAIRALPLPEEKP